MKMKQNNKNYGNHLRMLKLPNENIATKDPERLLHLVFFWLRKTKYNPSGPTPLN